MLPKAWRIILWFCSMLHTASTLAKKPDSQAAMCTAIKPPPAGQVCGDRGYLHKPKFELRMPDNSSVPRLSACRDLCAVDSRLPGPPYDVVCSAFAYDASKNICVLYTVPLHKQGFFKDAGSPFQFYSITCFNCASGCPHPPGTNVVENGGFEFSNHLIGPWSVAAGPHDQPKVVSPGHNSKHALRVQDKDLRLTQYQHICEGQKYTFSVDIKITNDSAPPNAADPLLVIDSGELEIRKEGGYDFGSWHTFQGTTQGTPAFLKPSPPHLTLYAIDYEGGESQFAKGYTFYLDNFIAKATNATYKLVGKNLLVNGGFESGKLHPWTASDYLPREKNGVRKIGVVPGGLTAGSKYTFRYIATEYQYGGSTSIPGEDNGSIVLEQIFHLVKGQLYQLSFEYQADFIDHIAVEISDAKGAAGDITWSVLGSQGTLDYFNDYQNTDGRLVTFSRVFKGYTSLASLSLTFEGSGDYQQRKERVFIDNVVIKALADGQSL